jgi:pSer/pThr/pTyr-binding forkhead associated (FHA) protein
LHCLIAICFQLFVELTEWIPYLYKIIEEGPVMPAQLISIGNGPSITLDKPIILLGRQEECDVVLESRKVSRKHCCFAHVGNIILIRDLGSTNGISVNGKRVSASELNQGDMVSIGGHSFEVRWESLPGINKKPAALNKPSYESANDRPVPISEPSIKPNSSGGNLMAMA